MQKTKILFILTKALLLSGAWITVSPMIEIPDIAKGYEQPGALEHHFLTILRDRNTHTHQFREATNLLTPLLAQRTAEHLSATEVSIFTPITKCRGIALQEDIILIPIMRSGLTLLEGFQRYFKKARVGHMLIQRNEETAKAEFKYFKAPSHMFCKKVVILEPMIATGGTLTVAIKTLLNAGVNEKDIIVASVVAAPEGLLALQEKFPAISVVVISIDEGLTYQKYIFPGLGDFGDRYYGTEDEGPDYFGGPEGDESSEEDLVTVLGED